MLSSSSKAIDVILSHMLWALLYNLKPQVEKWTTWGADCSHDISRQSSEKWPQGNGNNPTLELKMDGLWNNQGDTGQTARTDFMMTIRTDCTVPACSTFPPSIKALVNWLSVTRSQHLNRSLPTQPPTSCLVAGLWNKANFPFNKPCLFTDFCSTNWENQ